MYKLLPILLFAYGLAITTDDIYDNSYALIIGIDKYENVRSLDYAVKDAEDIQSMLVDKFHFQQDNIVLLKNEEATKTSILQEFSNITKKAGANDRVLIFFAGHGETEDLPDGGEMGYLLPVDGNNTDLYISAIEMDEIQTISLRSEAKHILYLIDACYGGIASVGARGLDAKSTPDYLQKITQYKSRQIISAGGRGEQVIEKAEWGHSAFTKNLLSGLRDSKADTDSDGIITAQELGTYLQKKVTIDSDNRQTPKTRNLSTDEGEFVFVYAANESTDAKLDYLIEEMEELKSQKSSGDNQIQKDLLNSSNLKFNRDRHKYIIASLHSHIGIMVEHDRFINDRKQAISFGVGVLPANGYSYGLSNSTILLTFSPSFSIKNYLGESGDIYWHYGLGLNLLTEFKETQNNFYGFEALIGWGQIGFNKKSILFGLPLRSLKISTGYQILFIPGESQNVSEIFVDRGIELKVAIGYSHKRSYSEGVKIYQD